MCACLWRVFEFDMYRKNAKYAEAELRKLLFRTCNKSNEVLHEGTENVTELMSEGEMNVATDPMEDVGNDNEVSLKNEIDIEEWEMPRVTPSESVILEEIKNEAGEEVVKETDLLVQDISKIEEEQQEEVQPEKDTLMISTANILEQNYAEYEVQIEELEELQSTDSCDRHSSECLAQMDDIFKNLSSKSSSSVARPSGISGKNKEMCEKSIKDVMLIEKRSILSLKLRSCNDPAESGSLSSAMAVQRKRKPFICDVCKKSCDTKRDLGRHVRVHCDDRPFKCGECGKSFKWKKNKIEHELTHLKKQKENERGKKKSTKKCYVCEICKKEYQTRVGLYYHSNVHKNKYLCSFCGKRCASKTILNVHLRSHTKEKPFSCEVCKRAFNLKNHLKRHLATHSDNRPFQCNVCDKRFKTKDHKNQHKLYHLRGK